MLSVIQMSQSEFDECADEMSDVGFCLACGEQADGVDDDNEASAAGLILDGSIDGETGEVTDEGLEDDGDDEASASGGVA